MKSPCEILFDDRNWMLVSETVLNLNQKKKILELGCGIGTHLTHFAKMGHECTGVDISKDSIRKANFLNKEFCSFIIADGCHLPFTNESFDIIYSTETLSHVADLPRSLNEQIHSLKQKGELMVRDSNLLFPLVLINLLFFYPFKTHGKYGGLKWILNYDKIINNIYDTGSYGKDENIKTLNWWRIALMNYPNLKLKVATTSYVVSHPNWFTRLTAHLTGQVVVVAEKVGK